MEIYLIVPESPSLTKELAELCKRLFSARKESVEIRASVNEKCAKVAAELADCIGLGATADQGTDTVERSILVFVLPLFTASLVARHFDPANTSPSIRLDALVPIRDTRK